MGNSVKTVKFQVGGWGEQGRLLQGKFLLIIPACDLQVTTASSETICGFGTGNFPVELSHLLVVVFTHTKYKETEGPTEINN